MSWDPGSQQRRLPPADSSDPLDVVFSGDIPANADFGVNPPSVFHTVFTPPEPGVYFMTISTPEEPGIVLASGNLLRQADGALGSQIADYAAPVGIYYEDVTDPPNYKFALDRDVPTRVLVKAWKIA